MRQKTRPLDDPFHEAMPPRGFGLVDGIFLLVACGFFLGVLIVSLGG